MGVVDTLPALSKNRGIAGREIREARGIVRTSTTREEVCIVNLLRDDPGAEAEEIPLNRLRDRVSSIAELGVFRIIR